MLPLEMRNVLIGKELVIPMLARREYAERIKGENGFLILWKGKPTMIVYYDTPHTCYIITPSKSKARAYLRKAWSDIRTEAKIIRNDEVFKKLLNSFKIERKVKRRLSSYQARKLYYLCKRKYKVIHR